jgi:hypothetical protein
MSSHFGSNFCCNFLAGFAWSQDVRLGKVADLEELDALGS